MGLGFGQVSGIIAQVTRQYYGEPSQSQTKPALHHPDKLRYQPTDNKILNPPSVEGAPCLGNHSGGGGRGAGRAHPGGKGLERPRFRPQRQHRPRASRRRRSWAPLQEGHRPRPHPSPRPHHHKEEEDEEEAQEAPLPREAPQEIEQADQVGRPVCRGPGRDWSHRAWRRRSGLAGHTKGPQWRREGGGPGGAALQTTSAEVSAIRTGRRREHLLGLIVRFKNKVLPKRVKVQRFA